MRDAAAAPARQRPIHRVARPLLAGVACSGAALGVIVGWSWFVQQRLPATDQVFAMHASADRVAMVVQCAALVAAAFAVLGVGRSIASRRQGPAEVLAWVVACSVLAGAMLLCLTGPGHVNGALQPLVFHDLGSPSGHLLR